MPIYAPHGSAILLHRRYFEQGGHLRCSTLMYGEELHVAEQARAAGLQVVWAPMLRLEHRPHATTKGIARAQHFDWKYESWCAALNLYFTEEAAPPGSS